MRYVLTKAGRHRLLYWLLPLLVMRAFVPVGFMLDTTQGHLSLVFCDGFGPAPKNQSTAHAHHQHHAQQSGHGEHASHEGGSLCPFAVASGAAPTLQVAFAGDALLQLVAIVVTDIPGIDIPFGPVRAQQSRAPPQFLI